MTFSSDDLQRIVHTVWSTQIRFNLDSGDPAELARRLTAEDMVSIEVAFVGDFNGKLVQRCSQHVSLTAAAAAFSTSGSEVEVSDIRDTVTEMAHMTAGNLKSLLPGECRVCEAGEVPNAAGSEKIIATAGFTFEGEPLVVDLIQRS